MTMGVLAISVLALAHMHSLTIAIDPNNVCCHLANDPESCKAYVKHQSTSFDNCVGGIGVDCEGVQQNLDFGPAGKLSINIVKPIENSDGTVTLDVSVGSILHDLCCIKHPNGAFCTSSNYPIRETINLSGGADNSCACIMEWRKAAWNTIRDRKWKHTFSKAPGSSDLSPNSRVKRRSYLPTSWRSEYLPQKSTWGLEEVAATGKLCAPKGTRLDCPGVDRNCQVPCIGTMCKACATGCSRRHRRRWNSNGRNHAKAGDSEYCCSGTFSEVVWKVSGSRYGTCA